jgi:hypothetical protein
MPVTQTVAAQGVKKIPYDYVARFQLTGQRGNRVQQVINISVEGSFVATEIGYSFISARLPEAAVQVPGATPTVFLAGLPPILDHRQGLVQCPINACVHRFQVQLIDSGTGRELQDQPSIISPLASQTASGLPPAGRRSLFQPRLRSASRWRSLTGCD